MIWLKVLKYLYFLGDDWKLRTPCLHLGGRVGKVGGEVMKRKGKLRRVWDFTLLASHSVSPPQCCGC